MTSVDPGENEEDGPVPGMPAINRVYEIVRSATIAKRPSLPQSDFERRWARIGKIMMAQVIPSGIIMCATALLAILLNSGPLINVMLVFAIICELFVIAMMGSTIIGGTPFLWRLRKAPYAPLLTLVELSSRHDLPFVEELSSCPRVAVQYVLTQYKQERNSFEKRSGMLAGSIDKVGIFPALAGLVITASNLIKLPGSTAWGSFFGPLLLILYIQALTAAQLIQNMDRVIALLEFSLQSRK